MRPTSQTFIALASIALLACAAEPEGIFDPEPADVSDENIGSDPIDETDTTGEEQPPTIAIPTDPDRIFGGGGGEISGETREAQIAACSDNCDGVYDRHGTLPHAFCLCRASDAGQHCEAGSDCESECLFVGLEEASDGMAVPFGECAEFEQVYGCYEYLPESSAGPVDAEEFAAPWICVD